MRAFVIGCGTNRFINKPLQNVPHAFLTIQTPEGDKRIG